MSGKLGGANRWRAMVPGGQHPLQHSLAFLLSGSLAFITDAGILKLLTAAFGIHPLVARLVSLSFAHVVGWLSHRRFTFRLTTPPTLRELVRYAGVQSTVAVLNYAIYSAIILARPGIEPVLALVMSSGVAMFFSYFGIRFAAFRQHRRSEQG